MDLRAHNVFHPHHHMHASARTPPSTRKKFLKFLEPMEPPWLPHSPPQRGTSSENPSLVKNWLQKIWSHSAVSPAAAPPPWPSRAGPRARPTAATSCAAAAPLHESATRSCCTCGVTTPMAAHMPNDRPPRTRRHERRWRSPHHPPRTPRARPRRARPPSKTAATGDIRVKAIVACTRSPRCVCGLVVRGARV